MTSTFTWLDYSEHDRRKMLDVISLFDEKETRDELGIGGIRDAFADLLFPGTSTIQSRARYLLFVPWMYLGLEARWVPSSQFGKAARDAELALITPLAHSADPAGTIGRIAGAALQRLPSNIYWLGLERLGIRLFHGSQDQYHRSITSWYASQRQAGRGDPDEQEEATLPNWHGGLPPSPADFPAHPTFALLPEEAAYLRERILSHAGGTLFAYLVDQPAPPPAVDAPWQHPGYGEFPVAIQEQLTHARHFADVMHGAPLLYNWMLAEQVPREDLIGVYESQLHAWAADIDGQRASLLAWNRTDLWDLITSGTAQIGHNTREFVNGWIDLTLDAGGAAGVIAGNRARELVHARERTLKRQLARLDNRQALEIWTGAAGLEPLRYRWKTARPILVDIVSGLSREVPHA